MRGCYYGAGVAGKVEHPLGSSEATDSQLVRFEAGAPQTIDRVVIREDQTDGQVRGEPSFLSSLSLRMFCVFVPSLSWQMSGINSYQGS
jgi:hypothetical protein